MRQFYASLHKVQVDLSDPFFRDPFYSRKQRIINLVHVVAGLDVLKLRPQFFGPAGIAFEIDKGENTLQPNQGIHFIHHLVHNSEFKMLEVLFSSYIKTHNGVAVTHI